MDDCPDGVFVEDQVVVFGDVAVLCRSGAPPRRAEQAGLREALEPVGYRCVSIEAPGTFDANGWLQIGFCGHQPGVGETYISTGSVYLCAVGLLPLGLPSTDPFWSDPPQPWTSVRAWGGQPFPIDRALKE